MQLWLHLDITCIFRYATPHAELRLSGALNYGCIPTTITHINIGTAADISIFFVSRVYLCTWLTTKSHVLHLLHVVNVLS